MHLKVTTGIAIVILCVLFNAEVVIAEPQFNGDILKLRNVVSLEVLEDPNNSLDIDKIISSNHQYKFEKYNDKSFNFGLKQTTVWLRISFTNDILNHIDFLEVDNPYLDLVKLYIPTIDESYIVQEAGDSIPFNQRPNLFRTFIFNIGSFTNELPNQPYYLQIRSGGDMHFILRLWSDTNLFSYTSNSQALMGFYFGLIIVMALYNLFIFFNIRENSNLLYVIYIICFGLFIGSRNGIAFQYLWPNNPDWAQISTIFFTGLVIISAFAFSREFLQTSKHTPRLDKIILILMGFAFVEILMSLAREVPMATKWSVAIGLCLPPIIWLSGVLSWFAGYRPARFLVIAWSFFLITILIGGFTHAGLLPINTFTGHSMQIGSGVEIILLSWALADRMSILIQEKEKQQISYQEKLQQHNLTLEQQVQARTLKLNEAAEIANQKANLLEKVNYRLEEIATRDGLTGLLNHSAFIEQFKHIIEDAKRYEYYISVLILDIDNFKKINDTFGHIIGNKVLCSLSNILKDELRESDIAARFGGDEFLIVLTRATHVEAVDKAEKLRHKFSKLKLNEAEKLLCSISIGVTTVDWRNHHTDYNLILKSADSAMYRAKKLGKNKVCTSDVDYKIIYGNTPKT